MAENKLLKSFNELPPWSKGAIAVAGVVIAFVVYLQVRKGLRSATAKNEALAPVKSADNELKNLQKQGIAPTITKAQADAWASQLVKQYSNADLLLESFPVTKRIFEQLKNDADYLLLRQSFGVRTYPDALWGNVSNVTLEAAIQDELTNSSISQLNAVLSKKGITYKI